MKRIGWMVVVLSLVFLGIIMPGFIDGFATGSTHIGIAGWILITLFLVIFVSGVRLASSRED